MLCKAYGSVVRALNYEQGDLKANAVLGTLVACDEYSLYQAAFPSLSSLFLSMSQIINTQNYHIQGLIIPK